MGSKKSGAPPGEFRLVLSPNAQAGRRARDAIRERFAGRLPDAALTDLVSVVTELVNNSVEHGPGRPITVALAVGRESIRGEVSDQGNPAVAAPSMMEETEARRLGMEMVDKLTSAWAVYEGSTHVWFELPLRD